MGCGNSNKAGEEARIQEQERLARVEAGKTKIDEAFAPFDDTFYANRVKDYESFAVPQLSDQYARTQKNLKYSLARAGLLGSGVEADKGAALDKERAQQYRNVVDAGQGQANELRQNIEGQRSNLVSQLQASSDPGSAGALAQRTAASFQTPTSYAPIGNFFEGWTKNYLANQTAQQYNPSTAPLFSWGGSTQRVVAG